jgi:hypothetical protein
VCTILVVLSIVVVFSYFWIFPSTNYASIVDHSCHKTNQDHDWRGYSGEHNYPSEYIEHSSSESAHDDDDEYSYLHYPKRVRERWGEAFQPQSRLQHATYGSGVLGGGVGGTDRPNPRYISNYVSKQEPHESFPNNKRLTDWAWLWGQWVDHNIVSTRSCEPPENMYVDMTGDPVYDPHGNDTSSQRMHMTRSNYTIDHYGVRQQVNSHTPFMDACAVYGVGDRVHHLRKYEGGLLKTTDGHATGGDGPMPPFNTAGLPNDPHPGPNLYLLGDLRANEHPALTAVHTLWVREHNWWARHYHEQYPTWSDDKLFENARARVIGEIVAITYNEWLPALLGVRVLDTESCFDVHADPRIDNEFAAAAFRFGHSMVNDHIYEHDTHTGQQVGEHKLLDLFFHNEWLYNGSMNVGKLLLGAAKHMAQDVDPRIVDSMRNARLSHDNSPFDLVTFNIMRGRDHGLPPYTILRWLMGGSTVHSWYDITHDEEIVQRLKHVYGDEGWNKLDAYVGLVAEEHYPGSALGYTAHHIVLQQFKRLLLGDHFAYLWNDHFTKDVTQIHGTRLKDVILRNTNVKSEHMQDNVFFFPYH